MANLAILKLYQFNPHLINDQVIINILVKALTAIPNPDFNLCLYLLHENAPEDETIAKLIQLQQLLEQCQYKEFWFKYENPEFTYRELTADAIGFENDIRKVIATTIAISYQSISKDLLRTYLHFEKPEQDAEFIEFLDPLNWKESDSVINIPINKDNEAKPTVIRENIKFEQLTKVIGYSNEL